MSDKTYILCPGQGAQVVGMGVDLYESSPAAKAVFDQANQVLSFDLAGICFGGPEERLHQTDISQPALYVTGIASFRAAIETGRFDAAQVTAYAGLSLGEYTALHLAGSLSFEDGLRLVHQRGRFMQEAAEAWPGGMVAIIGGDENAVRNLCQDAAGGQVLVPANFNAPGQIVISGDKAACDRALSLGEATGLRGKALTVAGAFHSPLMESAARKMELELSKAALVRPSVPVYSNVTAQPHEDAASIKGLLVDQIVKPVRWEQIMTALVADGDGRFIELAPGRTLAGLAKRISRRLIVEENAGWQKPEKVMR